MSGRHDARRAGLAHGGRHAIEIAAAVPMVIRKSQQPADGPARRRERGLEARGLGDAGHRHHGPATAGPRPLGFDRDRLAERAAEREGRQRRKRGRDGGGAAVGRDERVRARQRAHRLAQSAKRHPAILKVIRRHQDEIDVARHLPMLKPVVEQHDRRPERALGERARDRALLAHEHDRAGHAARDEQRLVAAAIEIRRHVRAVAHDDDAWLDRSPPVSSAQDGRPLARVNQQPRQMNDDRRLAPPAHRDVADGDAGVRSFSTIGVEGARSRPETWPPSDLWKTDRPPIHA